MSKLKFFSLIVFLSVNVQCSNAFNQKDFKGKYIGSNADYK